MKLHRTDLVSFAFGLLFLVLAAWWLLAQVLGLVLPPVGWFLAGGLILIGALGLIGAVRASRHSGRPAPADITETEANTTDIEAVTETDTAAGTDSAATDTTGTAQTTAGTGAAAGSEVTVGTDIEQDRTLELFARDETPPPGPPGRDA